MLSCGGRVSEVTVHHRVASHYHLAQRLGVSGHVPHGFIDHTDFSGTDMGKALTRLDTGQFFRREIRSRGDIDRKGTIRFG